MLRGHVAVAGSEGLKKGTELSNVVISEYPRSQWWMFAIEDERLRARSKRFAHSTTNPSRALNSASWTKVEKVQRGDEMPPGVMKMVKVFVAVKRKIQPGDKMAGRHGNKGVVSRIVPIEDMPFLEDGTHVDVVLNPLGVPSAL